MPRIVATFEETDEVYKALGIRNYRPAMSVRIACSGLPLSQHELRYVGVTAAIVARGELMVNQ